MRKTPSWWYYALTTHQNTDKCGGELQRDSREVWDVLIEQRYKFAYTTPTYTYYLVLYMLWYVIETLTRVAVTSPVDPMWKHSNAHEVYFGIGAVQFIAGLTIQLMYMVQGVDAYPVLSNNTGTQVWPDPPILWEICWLESWCVVYKESTQVAKLRFVFRPRSTNCGWRMHRKKPRPILL